MPDWSYHTLFTPILFRLPASTARDVTLRLVSTLGSVPGGSAIIDFLGHMGPDESLAFDAIGCKFVGAVGLAGELCSEQGLIRAFSRFGFGFLEAGPVTLNAVPHELLELRANEHLISNVDAPVNLGLKHFLDSCLPNEPPALPLFVRLAHEKGTTAADACSELEQIRAQLPQWCDAIVLDGRWCLPDFNDNELSEYFQLASRNSSRTLLALPPDLGRDDLSRLVSAAMDSSIAGISITGGIRINERRMFGRPAYENTLSMVKAVRAIAPSTFIVAGDGVIEPADAIAMLEAGANAVTIYAGFVCSGPGLPKRINETISAQKDLDSPAGVNSFQDRSPYSLSAVARSGWIGFVAVGIGLIITGSSAITVGLTSVILPYDEAFLGMTRQAMMELNSNLLPFLSHDRVTYAGAGMSCGLLFAGLAFFGARKGQDWAYVAARNSCGVGFLSFLLFLGFHFLDPLHATATLFMLPFYLWAVMIKPRMRPMKSSNLRNTKSWYRSLQGQFWFVCIGVGLLLAGITICKVGTSTVFVPEDLMFLHTTAHDLLSHNDRLLPDIAHDRAGFGGALVTAGIAVLLTSLYGFRQGEGWVWWMLLVAGLPGFVSTLAIHYAIGYTHLFHLLPAYLASLMFIAGLSLSYQYLCVEPGVKSVEQF